MSSVHALTKNGRESTPNVYARELTPIPEYISPLIDKIRNKDYRAYLVGGCVRDMLLGASPKDFDIATDARPEELLKIFPRESHIIGRRFPIVHVVCGTRRIEVTTFRGSPPKPSPYIQTSKSGQILVDNHYGNESEDAVRRDLTINALYYDPLHKQVIDYVGGMDDIQTSTINVIGKPGRRFCEDPVRMIRCIRLANKLNFTMPKSVARSIENNAHLIRNIAPARLFEELLKLLLCGQAKKNYETMARLNLFQAIFSQLSAIMQGKGKLAQQSGRLVDIALKNTDIRIATKKSITPAFLIAALLWPQVRKSIGNDTPVNRHTIMLAGYKVLAEQNAIFRIPKRFSMRIMSFWQMQYDLQWPTISSSWSSLNKKDFRAAYDLLLIRLESGELQDYRMHTWWQSIQECAKEQERQKLISVLPQRKRKSIHTSISNSFFTY